MSLPPDMLILYTKHPQFIFYHLTVTLTLSYVASRSFSKECLVSGSGRLIILTTEEAYAKITDTRDDCIPVTNVTCNNWIYIVLSHLLSTVLEQMADKHFT